MTAVEAAGSERLEALQRSARELTERSAEIRRAVQRRQNDAQQLQP